MLLALCFSSDELDKNANETAKVSALEISEEKQESKSESPIIIHGSAVTVLKKNMALKNEETYNVTREETITVGRPISKMAIEERELMFMSQKLTVLKRILSHLQRILFYQEHLT
ncbi:hypothetical protein [Psychroserpens burtonensis]|uniref:hypothetical protein n=1 Tax=Psychroserpens burtonensis TaxID=49278 RepID=UPI0012FC4819|nr:hypothetical protein [Psychroserpens burtonensis]